MSKQLHDAIVNEKDIEQLLKKLKRQQHDIFTTHHDGEDIPTLHLAAQYDKKGNNIRILIENGADIERYRYQPYKDKEYVPSCGKGDCTALAFAVLFTNYNATTTLLELGADPNGKDHNLETPMVYAAFLDDIDEAEKYLDLLVAWFGEFDLKLMESILKNSNSNFDYEKDFFFNGDKKQRIKLFKYLEKIYKESKLSEIELTDEEDIDLEEEEDLPEEEPTDE